MSLSPELSMKGKTSEEVQPEKSNFIQSCSRLRQFLNERRSSTGDLGFGMTKQMENIVQVRQGSSSSVLETKNLLIRSTELCMPRPNEEASEDKQTEFHLINFVDFGAFAGSKEINPATENSRTTKGTGRSNASSSADMTIFYAGKVIVFNDFPADKLRDIAHLAGCAGRGCETQKKMSSEKSTSSDPPPAVAAAAGGILHARPGDLPLAMKTSLHRFFAKRKDRASSRAPYQVNP